MPKNMTNNKRQRVRAIFAEAYRKKTTQERSGYLDEACGSDKGLRAEVESLLEAHDKYGNYLEDPPIVSEVTLNDFPLSESPGTTIDKYKLLEKIGEGGMAVVYMAEQEEPLKRKIALKIIKPGMDTKQVIARFEAERQTLAMMEHPNIAKVVDAGATETGRPYFVMELVKGVSITDYCDKNKLSTKERLDLFISVCNAVQHAHQKGIIHRDIKPSNVMVTLRDGKPVPKVIDFGIAKATSQRLTEKTLFTRYAQMIGTPAYMSPEQAEFSELDIDTRTDIYSLGVLLYELLIGATPLDEEKLREAGYLEMQRIILEEEPLKPSTRLTTLGEALTDVAEHRKASPDLLRKLVSGDLDWIVMKSLEKDRTRRYDTAVELSADIIRHLNSEPVQAAAPSSLYIANKFVTRHRIGFIAGLLVAAALLIGVIGTTVGLIEANSQRKRALAHFAKAQEAVDEITQMAQWRLSDGTVAYPQMVLQREMVLRSLVFYQEFLEERKDDPKLLREIGRAYRFLGDINLPLNNFEQSEQAYRQAIDIFEKLMSKFPNRTDYQREIAGSKYGLGFALQGLGQQEAAEEFYRTAAALLKPLSNHFNLGTPTNLGPKVNSPSVDSTPCISADGLSLYFQSSRAGGLGSYDIWISTRLTISDPWDTPVNLGSVVNSPSYEGSPNISADGLTLLFNSRRPGGSGSQDLWVTTRETTDSDWNKPVNLGRVVNSTYLDATPSISGDGLSLYFESNRPGGVGGWDMWVTMRETTQSEWEPPVNLGPNVNSSYLEQTVNVSADGLFLFLASNRLGSFGVSSDLWASSRSKISDTWGPPVNLGPMVNSATTEACPNISADGSTLYFASSRPGGQGSWDLWQVPIISMPAAPELDRDADSTKKSTEIGIGKELKPTKKQNQ